MMKKLQKLGKALMLPVAALPICGILMGLGYAIAPGVMGVPGAATSGALYNIGFLLIKAGGALIDNMAWLFVIGVAVGLSDDREGTSALAGLVSWLMMTNLLSTGVVTTLMPAIADDPVKTLAFDKIQNVFIAIIAGIIGSSCYNRFKNANFRTGWHSSAASAALHRNRSGLHSRIRCSAVRMADHLQRSGSCWRRHHRHGRHWRRHLCIP